MAHPQTKERGTSIYSDLRLSAFISVPFIFKETTWETAVLLTPADNQPQHVRARVMTDGVKIQFGAGHIGQI